MQGQEYLTINPDTFSDATTWSYNELQKLCSKLSLGGKGTRVSLEEKLISWHRQRVNTEEPEEEKFEMNVPGNNFSLLQINVQSRAEGPKPRRKSGVVGLNETADAVSPSILRPFLPQTPSKGILKKRPANLEMNASEYIPPVPVSCTPNKKLSKLTFSPYNGVKVISHRHEDLFSRELFA